MVFRSASGAVPGNVWVFREHCDISHSFLQMVHWQMVFVSIEGAPSCSVRVNRWRCAWSAGFVVGPQLPDTLLSS